MEKLNKIYLYLLSLFAMSIPFAGFNIPKYILGILILFKFYLIFNDLKHFQILIKKKKFVLLALLIYPIFLGISLFYSTDFYNGLKIFGRYSFCFILPFVLLNSNDIKIFKGIVLGYILGVFLLVILNFILIFINWDDPLFYSYGRFYYQNLSSYVNLHPGYYSLIIASSLFFVLVYLKGSVKIILGLLFCAILFLLSSKGIIICSLIGFFYWLFKINKRLMNINIVVVLSIISVFLLVFLSQTHTLNRVKQSIKSFENISNVYNDPNNRLDENLLRFFLFKYSIDTIKSTNYSILFGFGIGDYQDELLKTYEKEKYGYGLHYKYNSHNQYLTTVLMIGLLGVLLFLIFLTTPILFSNKKNIAILYFILFIGYAFIESYFTREVGILITCFFVSIFSILEVPKQVSFKRDFFT